MKNVVEGLVCAKALLVGKWTGDDKQLTRGKHSIGTALMNVFGNGFSIIDTSPMIYIDKALRERGFVWISHFEFKKGRTENDVLELFDRAIELARKS